MKSEAKIQVKTLNCNYSKLKSVGHTKIEAVYLAKLVPHALEDIPLVELSKFFALIDMLNQYGLIEYAELGPPIAMNIADFPYGKKRSMLLYYPFSRFSREELNSKLGFEYFIQEGDIAKEWPDDPSKVKIEKKKKVKEDPKGPWVKQLSEFLDELDKTTFPSDGICHHLGKSVELESLIKDVGILPRDPTTTLLTFYGSRPFPAQVFEAYIEGCATIAPVIDTWNGKEGNSGVSIVIARSMPKGYKDALENYAGLRNVFQWTREEQKRGRDI